MTSMKLISPKYFYCDIHSLEFCNTDLVDRMVEELCKNILNEDMLTNDMLAFIKNNLEHEL